MSDEPDNPFKGTPFEAMFQQFSGAAGAGGTPDLNAIFAQVQQLLSGSTDGKPVNWDLAKDIARKTVSAAGDRSITPADTDRVSDAVRLAEHWLDEATTLPEVSATSAAWSRAEWVENTLPVWQTIVDPVAEHVAGAMGNALPAEAQQFAGPMAGMLRPTSRQDARLARREANEAEQWDERAGPQGQEDRFRGLRRIG